MSIYVRLVIRFEIGINVMLVSGVGDANRIGSGFGRLERVRHGKRDVLAVVANDIILERRATLIDDAVEPLVRERSEKSFRCFRDEKSRARQASFPPSPVSSLVTRPLAIVASTGTAYNIPGKWKSEAYCAAPLTFNGPSTRGVLRPIGDVVGVSCVVGMFGYSLGSWVTSFSACTRQRLANSTLKPF